MAPKAQRVSQEQELADNTAVDYSHSMFEDGNNRAEKDQKVHDAPDYDKAVNKEDADVSDAVANDAGLTQPVDTYHSRDGTDASGILDEDGGALGGTEAELDSLEVGATPVDKNPRMKG